MLGGNGWECFRERAEGLGIWEAGGGDRGWLGLTGLEVVEADWVRGGGG